ncbi:acyltransferase [Zobellia sp.]|nr:acyltransferase [Zobellia sp.]
MKSITYIPGLTPLRGIAALLVILLHYNMMVTSVITSETSPIIDKLYLMVDLFFVLSGFIMYHVYGDYFLAGATLKRIGGFLRARFARIYPLHLITLLFMVGLGLLAYFGGSHEGMTAVLFDFTAVPSQLLLTQAMGTHHEATFNSPSWSISVEWWAYVAFPFVLLFLVRTKVWSRWLLGVGIIGGYLAIMYYFQPEFWAERWRQLQVPESITYPVQIIDVITGGSAFLRCMCGFVWGMLVYELFLKNWAKVVLKNGIAFIGIWALFLGLWHFQLLPDYGAVFLFGMLILAAAYNRDGVGKVLNNRFWEYMGDISYSIYMVHMPIIFTFIFVRGILVNPDPLKGVLGYNFSPIVSWLGLVAMYIITILIASVTYKYIEKPARSYLKQVGKLW